jgi:hypothetical protein
MPYSLYSFFLINFAIENNSIKAIGFHGVPCWEFLISNVKWAKFIYLYFINSVPLPVGVFTRKYDSVDVGEVKGII